MGSLRLDMALAGVTKFRNKGMYRFEIISRVLGFTLVIRMCMFSDRFLSLDKPFLGGN